MHLGINTDEDPEMLVAYRTCALVSACSPASLRLSESNVFQHFSAGLPDMYCMSIECLPFLLESDFLNFAPSLRCYVFRCFVHIANLLAPKRCDSL